MPRVFLYEDAGGALYLHKEGDEFVLSGIELSVPYGAEFQRDADALASGAQPGEGNGRIPLNEFTDNPPDHTVRAVAVWEDGEVRTLHTLGRDARTYIEAYHRDSTPVMPGYQK